MIRYLKYWALLLVLLPIDSRGGLTFSLTPAIQSAATGTQIVFSGTLTNNSSTDNVLLNDIHFDLNGAASTALTPDTNSFFANVPGVLLPGETYTGPIFTVLLGASAAPGDYSGTVTIQGGSDLFAAVSLQAANFQLSAPVISASAITADAYEFGPVPGVVVISRGGNSNYDLPVHYAVSGSAANGIRYSFLSGVATIPNGSSSTTINVVPIPNDVADGDQTVGITISSDSGYNIGSATNGIVTIHDKPIDSWRLEYFPNDANNAAIAGDTADPDNDGITNLMEYGLGSSPTINTVAPLPLATISANHLQLKFNRNTGATDITYIVEARADLGTGMWSAIMTRSPGNGWSANQPGATASETGSGDVVAVTITDSVPIIDPNTMAAFPSRFLRLRVQR